MEQTDAGADLRFEMVALLRRRGDVSDDRVAAALGAVQRHAFLPGVDLVEAYADRAVPTHFRYGVATSAASQPAIVATMLQSLRPQPGAAVLEIGAGTGYNAALLSWLVGPAGRVVTVDIDPLVVEEARRNLALAGTGNVEVICGDGADGWEPGGPYDGIVVTAGVSDLAPSWIAQLSADGRLVVPLSLSGVQHCMTFMRSNDHLESIEVCDCAFMPLVGDMANTDVRRAVPGHEGVFVEGTAGADVNPDVVGPALTAGGPLGEAVVSASSGEVFGNLRRWLAVHDTRAALLSYVGTAAGAGSSGVPAVLDFSGEIVAHRSSPCLLGHAGLAVVDLAEPVEDTGPGRRLHLAVRVLGAAEDEGTRLEELLRSWDAAGRPGLDRFHIDAYPAGSVPDSLDGSVHTARHTTFVVTTS